MRKSQNQKPARRLTDYITPYGFNFVHSRKPWVVAFWSAMFPGYGHIMLCKYGLGLILVTWETVINTLAGINSAIFYSCTGQFELAKKVLDKNWIFLYIGVYIFSIWDSYRRTIHLNNHYEIGYREKDNIFISNMSLLELNVLEKREPILALIWSLIVPGLGELYLHRFVTSAYFILWLSIVIKYSHIMPAMYCSFIGDFAQAKALVNPQWLLFLPSIVGFNAYTSYVNTVQLNRIYEREQAQYLKETYQDDKFEMPI